MRVLIVDDSRPVRQRLVQMVGSFDCVSDVIEAWDVDSALVNAIGSPPEAVILDLQVPGGGGIAILRGLIDRLKSRPRLIVLTNFPYPQVRRKCMEIGCDYFLDKSTDFGQLEEILCNSGED